MEGKIQAIEPLRLKVDKQCLYILVPVHRLPYKTQDQHNQQCSGI